MDQDPNNPLELEKGNGIVGEDGFVQWIKKSFLTNNSPNGEQPALREVAKGTKPEEVVDLFFIYPARIWWRKVLHSGLWLYLLSKGL